MRSAAGMSLRLEKVSYTYNEGDKNRERRAVRDVSFEIAAGEFVALIGHTGCGKSTLVQLLNGLLKPTAGRIYYDGRDTSSRDFPLKELRRHVGLVFQYPEYQLFEMTVLKDVCYGPKNLGLPKEEQEERAKWALRRVGIEESYEDNSPFELSGGEKRRVAIAGVLAMRPEILILDEPTAGLDPRGRREILDICRTLNENEGTTILLVSHSMDDVAEYASRILAMQDGRLFMDGTPREIFRRHAELEAAGLSAPQVVYVMEELKKRGLPVRTDVLTVREAKEEILRARKNGASETPAGAGGIDAT